MFFNDEEKLKKNNNPTSIKFSKKQKRNKYLIIYSILITLILFIFIWMIGEKNMLSIINEKFQQSYIFNLENKTSNAVNKSSAAIVTISDSEEKLKTGNYSDGNLSGVVVREDGIIITTYSKVINYDNIYVRLPSVAGNPMEAKMIYGDELIDIAVLKVDAEKLDALEFIDDKNIREGKSVIALGNAINDQYIGLVTRGIINSTNNTMQESDKSYRIIQVDAKFNKENFGGALVNSEGELIGICSEYITNKYNDEFYYVIEARAIIESITNYFESMDKLGIRGNRLIDDVNSIKGVYVVAVEKDSLAYRAGIRPTDIVLSVNGVGVQYSIEIFKYFKDSQLNGTKEIKFKILRDGKETEVNMDISG